MIVILVVIAGIVLVNLLKKPDYGPLQIDEDVTKINTVGWQDSAFISPDGNELYFAYMPYAQKIFMDIYFGKVSEEEVQRRGPIRPGNHGNFNFDTYKAVKNEDGIWGIPTNLNINSDYSLYSAKLSYDGNELYYVIREYDKNYGADDIYVSKKLLDGTWSPPENLGPNINTPFREDHPSLSSDGQTLYFTRSEKEVLGIEIMVSRKVDGEWSKAEKLSQPINQPNAKNKANHQPFITYNGKELYFTRMMQLYVSEKQGDGTWGEPVSVFPNLEGSGHASVTADSRYLYFLTAKNKESLERYEWSFVYSEKQADGSWGEPKLVD